MYTYRGLRQRTVCNNNNDMNSSSSSNNNRDSNSNENNNSSNKMMKGVSFWFNFSRPKSRSPIEDLYTTETRRTLLTCATASSAAKQRPPVRLRQQQQQQQPQQHSINCPVAVNSNNMSKSYSGLSSASSGMKDNRGSSPNPTNARSRSYHSLTATSPSRASPSKKSSTLSPLMGTSRGTLKPATSDTELSRRSASPSSYGTSYHFYRENNSNSGSQQQQPSSFNPSDCKRYSSPKSYANSALGVRQINMQSVALSPRLARRSLTALNRLTQIAQEGRKKLEAGTIASKPSSGSVTLRRTGTFTKEDDTGSRHAVLRRSGLSTVSSRQRPASIATTGLWRSSYAK